MLSIDIPGWKKLSLGYGVLDLNGTLSQAGEIDPGTKERVSLLSSHLTLFVLTADTRGTAESLVGTLPIRVQIIEAGRETEEKQQVIQSLGSAHVAYVGNGANDEAALEEASVGICIAGKEGCWARSALAADILIPSIDDALDLLLFPERLVATLRR
jgi:P-type E1-E2 ATPase